MAIQFDMSAVSRQFAAAEAVAQALPNEAYDYFVASTPIRTGNARRSTDLRGNTISADYAYADRLDNGYSSQSPAGMSAPTERYLQKRINTLIGKIK